MDNENQGERKHPDWYKQNLPWWLDFWYPLVGFALFFGALAWIGYGAYYLLSALF